MEACMSTFQVNIQPSEGAITPTNMDDNKEVENDLSPMLNSKMAALERTVKGYDTLESQATNGHTASPSTSAEVTGKSTSKSLKIRFRTIAPRPSAQLSIPSTTTTDMNTYPSQYRNADEQLIPRASTGSFETRNSHNARAHTQAGRKTTYISLEEQQKTFAGAILQSRSVDQPVNERFSSRSPTFSSQSTGVKQYSTPTLPNIHSKPPSRNANMKSHIQKRALAPGSQRPILPSQPSANIQNSSSKVAEDSSTIYPAVSGGAIGKCATVFQPGLRLPPQPQSYPQLQIIQEHYPQPSVMAPSRKRKRPSKAKKAASVAVTPVEGNGHGESQLPRLAIAQTQGVMSMNPYVIQSEVPKNLSTGSFQDTVNGYPALRPVELNASLRNGPPRLNISLAPLKSSHASVAGSFRPTNNNPFKSPANAKAVAPYAPIFSDTSRARDTTQQDPVESVGSTSTHANLIHSPDPNEKLQHLDAPNRGYDNIYVGSSHKSWRCRPSTTEQNMLSTSKGLDQQNASRSPHMDSAGSLGGGNVAVSKSVGESIGHTYMQFPSHTGMSAKHFGGSKDIDQENLAQYTNKQVNVSSVTKGNGNWVSGGMESGAATSRCGVSRGVHPQIPIDPRLINPENGFRFSSLDKSSRMPFGRVGHQVEANSTYPDPEKPESGRNYSHRVVEYKSPYTNASSKLPVSDATSSQLPVRSSHVSLTNSTNITAAPSVQVPKGLFPAKPRMGIFYPAKPGGKTRRTVSWKTLHRLTNEKEGQEQASRGMRSAKILEAARHLYPSLFNADASIPLFSSDDWTVQKLEREDIGIEDVIQSWESKAARLNHQANMLRRLQTCLPEAHKNFLGGGQDEWVEMLRYLKGEGVEEPAPEDFVLYSQSWRDLNERRL